MDGAKAGVKEYFETSQERKDRIRSSALDMDEAKRGVSEFEKTVTVSIEKTLHVSVEN
jgi:hypothetical protein